MHSWLSKLASKIVESLTEEIASFITGLIIIAVLVAVTFFHKQLTHHVTLTFPVWILILVPALIAVLPILFYHLIPVRGKKPRLRDRKDIRNAINQWLRELYQPANKNRKCHFSELDDRLRIKRGSSRRFLPYFARQHKCGLKAGRRTFVFEKLTEKNDLYKVLVKELESRSAKGQKEFELDCKKFADKVGWPVEAVRTLFFELQRPNGQFRITKMAKNRVKINILD